MPSTPDRRSDRGSATVHALTVVLVLSTVAVVGAGFGQLTVARHRAGAAADLAALAAASDLPHACAQAEATARRNGARLARCSRIGDDVTVVVEVTLAAPFGLEPTVSDRARAGPAREPRVGRG